MKQSWANKSIAALLAVVMMLSLLPVSVFASDAENGIGSSEGLPEGTEYSSAPGEQDGEGEGQGSTDDQEQVSQQAQPPYFAKNLELVMTYVQGDTAILGVDAASSDGGAITYQWYRNTENSAETGTPINGARGASYEVSTSNPGTMYFYAVATNTLGDSRASAASNVTMVTVTAPVQAEEPVPTPDFQDAPNVDLLPGLDSQDEPTHDTQLEDSIMPAAEGDEGETSGELSETIDGLTRYDGQKEQGNYYIKTPEQLVLLANVVNTTSTKEFNYSESSFTLLDDIDLSADCCRNEDGNWTPIGSTTSTYLFSGEFNGNNHKIYNLNITSNGKLSFPGLFGCTENIYIHDLEVEGVISAGSGNQIGGIAANTKCSETSTISNCISNVRITADTSSQVGGIIGSVNGSGTLTVQSCENQGAISCKQQGGGIVGYVTGAQGTLEECTNKGSISGRYSIGGIFGYISGSNDKEWCLTDCNNKGTITATTEHANHGTGGILGTCYSTVSLAMENCTNDGFVTGKSYVGGIVGLCLTGTTNPQSVNLQRCTNSEQSTVTGTSNVGGIIGFINHKKKVDLPATIENCINRGNVSGDANTAGIIGAIADIYTYTTAYIGKCENSGAITSSNTAGGIAGQIAAISTLNIEKCTNSGSVNAQQYLAGGIVAELAIGNMTDCNNTGAVTDAGNSYQSAAGGLAGLATGSVTIKNSQNSGAVSGAYHVGGLLGMAGAAPNAVGSTDTERSTELVLEASTNTGNVTGSSQSTANIGYAGGLVGLLHAGTDSSVRVVYCSNQGAVVTDNVIAFPQVGGLFGSLTTGSGGTAEIRYCSNTASVTGGNQVGGLAGRIGPWKDVPGELSFKNCYSSGAVTSNGNILPKDLQMGSAVGVADGTADSIAKVSNVFALDTGISAIGSNNGSADGSAFTLLSDSVMKDSSFLGLLGDAFTASGTGYPSINANAAPAKINVQFYGAENAEVKINGIATYAVTVDSGADLSFTVTGKEETNNVTSVSVDGVPITAADGTYSLSSIQSDTIVYVVTDGTTTPTPETKGEEVIFQFADQNDTPVTDVTVTVSSAGADETTIYQPDDSGHYHLEEGTYAVTAENSSYAALHGTFRVSESIAAVTTYSATLYPQNTATATLTLGLGGKDYYVEILNGDIVVATSNIADESTSSDTVFEPLPVGEYRYKATGAAESSSAWSGKPMGSGPLVLSAGTQTVKLRFVNFVGPCQGSGNTSSLSNPKGMLYKLEITDSAGTIYAPGSTEVYTGDPNGDPRGYAVLPSAPNGMQYHYRFVPNSEDYWGSSGTLYLYDSTKEKQFYGLNLSDDNYFIISPKATRTITIPQNASLRLYRFVKFYEPVEEIDIGAPTENATTKTYTVTVPTDNGKPIFYEVCLDGYVKYANTFIANGTSADSIVINEANLTPVSQANQVDTNNYEQNIITNAPDSKCVNLEVGQSFELYCFRTLQIVDGGNRYIEPDYHIEIISGNAVAIEETFYAGAIIKGVNNGVSFVRITYDGAVFYNHLYPSIAEQNVLVLAFIVGPNGNTVIDPGMINQSEFDRNYYIRSVNGVPQENSKCYAECTFTPTVKSGSGTITEVKIHAPITSNGTWDNNAWEPVKDNGDGSYTAKLVDGRSMIQITASDGSVAFYSLSAYGLDVQIDGDGVDKITQSDGIFNVEVEPESEIKISFKGLELPVPKLGAIYNPGHPDKTYLVYTLTGLGTSMELESTHTQYDIATVNDITVNTPNTPGLYMLTGGKIHTTSIGEASGGHRAITRGGENKGIFAGTDSGGNSSESILGLFGTLPNLNIIVTGEAETGGEHMVTFTVPDATVRVIVRNHLGHIQTPTADGGYIYSLADNEDVEGGATYTYAVERTGYITQTGTITVTDPAQCTVDLTKADWITSSRSGSAVVNVIGDFAVPATNKVITIAAAPDDLYEQAYVDYNYGGYTVLHALLDTIGKTYRDCSHGVLTPKNIPTSGSGEWICSVNNVLIEDYANTLVNNGDQIVFYYKTAAQTQRAWFEPATAEAAKDGSATFTVKSISVDNTAASQAGTPVSGAILCIDGKEWTNATTGADGSATLTGLDKLARGNHTITVKKDGLTYARAILNITGGGDASSSGDTITVTFRLIGDKARGTEAYDQYVNWIGTTTCELPKNSTVGTLFTNVLEANGFTYEGVESNYVKSITPPQSLGGYKLSEKQNGAGSGWQYTVNGIHPDQGLTALELNDGDEVIWHYVNSYTIEGTDADSWYVNPWLFAADTAPGTSPSLPSGSAEVTSVKFGTKTLTRSGTTFTLTLAANETAPTAGSDFAIALADGAATKTEPVKKGDSWEFTVTASDGTTATYTIVVSISSEDPTPGTPLETTLKYLADNVTNPTVGSTRGEWAVLAQARGNALSETAKQNYLANLWLYADELKGVLDEFGFSHTEYSRVILALTSIGVDASNFKSNGRIFDFVAPLLDKNCTQVIEQGNNGTAFALIALDSGNYLNTDAGKKARITWVDSLAAEQNADGSWPILSGEAGSIDTTAMAVQALAPYYKDANKLSALGTMSTDHAKLKSMVDNAVAWLANQSGNNYGSCEAAAQMLVAMTALGTQEYAEKALESLLTYQVGNTGAFSTKAGGSANQMSTEQAAYALVAYDRFQNSKNSLYDMTDVTLSGGVDLDLVRTITVTCGAGGTVTPGTVKIPKGQSQTFTITPNAGYQIKDVKLNDKPVGIQNSYGFANVQENQSISVVFEKVAGAYAITTSSNGGGTISPSSATVLEGGSQMFYITPNAGYRIKDVKVNGVSQGAITSYPFRNVKADQTITAIFEPSDGITVYFTLKGDSAHGDSSAAVHTLSNGGLQTWISRQAVTVSRGATVYDVFTKVLNQYGYSYIGAEQNYVKTITTPSGVRLSEFTNGRNSGWMYTVNGTHPDQGLQSWTVYNGDEIIWHYTDDYTQERGGTGTSSTINGAAQLTPTVSGNNSTVTSNDFSNAVTAAINSNSGTVLIAPQGSAWASTLTVNLPTNTLYSAANNGVGVMIQSGAGTVAIPSYALSGIANVAGGSQVSVTTTVKSSQQGTNLLSGRTDVTSAQLANSAVVEVTMTSGGRNITSWGGRAITIDLPVNSNNFTSGNRYTVYQISESGSVEVLTGYCSRQNGTLYVEVSTSHLSTFVVVPGTATSASSTLPFWDVAATDWFYNEVAYVYNRGLFNGDSPTTFLPNNRMDRAMLVTVLHRYEGTPATSSTTGFSDVASGQWYSNGVAWANSTGVVNGKGDGKFAPFDSITREEIAVILYRYAKIKGLDVSASATLSSFYDGAQTSDWAMRAMQWANAKGIINGKGNGMLDPTGYATRAEVAAMLMRFIQSY